MWVIGGDYALRWGDETQMSVNAHAALPWVWRENLHLLQDVIAEDYAADLDPTVRVQ